MEDRETERVGGFLSLFGCIFSERMKEERI